MIDHRRGKSSTGGAERGRPVHKVTRMLARLHEQADGVRAELEQLRRQLADVRRELTTERTAELLEANENLVLATLQAESVADAAVSSLSELTLSAQRDVLTGTVNRALMLDRIEGAIDLARRHKTHVALLFLDLDDFKQINDTFGHAVGDAALQLAARRLKSVVRHSDTISRHGGDEFLVLLSEVAHEKDAVLIAEKILSTLAEASQVCGEYTIRLSASIGIAVYPESGDDAGALIAKADAAMYRAKKCGGGGGFRFSDSGTTEPVLAATQRPLIRHRRDSNKH